MLRITRAVALTAVAAVAVLSLAACAGGPTDDSGGPTDEGSTPSSAGERWEVVDKNALGTRISVLVKDRPVPEVFNTGTLEYDEDTQCWTLTGLNGEGNWPVVWVPSAEPQSRDGRAGVESPGRGLVSDGDDISSGGELLRVEDFINYPEECVGDAEYIFVTGGMRVYEGR